MDVQSFALSNPRSLMEIYVGCAIAFECVNHSCAMRRLGLERGGTRHPPFHGQSGLADMRMPEIDGTHTIVASREMKRVRGYCIDSAAHDHLAKPVDAEQLPALLRTRQYR